MKVYTRMFPRAMVGRGGEWYLPEDVGGYELSANVL